MRWLSILTALLVMLRVSGLADIPWHWVFTPIMAMFAMLTVTVVMAALTSRR